MKDHPKGVELLNTPIRFYEEMQTIFAIGMATSRYVVGSNEAIGVNLY
jgi:hypothetical protein